MTVRISGIHYAAYKLTVPRVLLVVVLPLKTYYIRLLGLRTFLSDQLRKTAVKYEDSTERWSTGARALLD